MSDSVSFVGIYKKASASRGSWQGSVNIAEEIEGDIGGQTFSLPAAMGAAQSISLGILSSIDLLIIETNQEVLLSLTMTSGTLTAVPVRETMILPTKGITAITLQNVGTRSAVVSLNGTKKKVET